MATKEESSSQHDQEGKSESTKTAAEASEAQKDEGKRPKETGADGSEKDEGKRPKEDGADGRLVTRGGAKILETFISAFAKNLVDKILEVIAEEFISAFAKSLADKILEMIAEEFRRRNEEKKAAKALESKTDEASQELMKTMKALQECIKELQESRQCECNLRAKLEKSQGKEEEETSGAEMISKFQQLSQGIETLEEHLQRLPKSSKHEFQLPRADQEK